MVLRLRIVTSVVEVGSLNNTRLEHSSQKTLPQSYMYLSPSPKYFMFIKDF